MNGKTRLIGSTHEFAPVGVYTTSEDIKQYTGKLKSAGYKVTPEIQDNERVENAFGVSKGGELIILEQVSTFSGGNLLLALNQQGM
ncbi:hypothetical protein [Streptomyces sp. NPDC051776]|uniref:hypothetical protein n=1 Tax=Streptomyces sp. NPDC051776 TaxID=3155414 RepID=UPI00341ABCF9